LPGKYWRLLTTEEPSKIYPPIYPLWGIAFARVFDYSGTQEDSQVGVTGWYYSLVSYLTSRRIPTVHIVIAPVIGTARVVSAASHITKAFYLAGELAGAAEAKQAEDGK
jgi:hypothetical protein